MHIYQINNAGYAPRTNISFQSRQPKIAYVRENKRAVAAEQRLQEIFKDRLDQAQKMLGELLIGNSPKETKDLISQNITHQTTVISDKTQNKVLLSIRRDRESAENEIKYSSQALKCTTYELFDSQNVSLRTAKVFSNNEGKYKIELYDADGTFTDEFLGARYYGKAKTGPSGDSGIYIKPVKNKPLSSNEGYEHIKYFKKANGLVQMERHSYDAYNQLREIRCPVYQNGKLSEIKVLSPNRKLIRTIPITNIADARSNEWKLYN